MTIAYNLAFFGRLCFAVALIAFGLEHFVLGEFISGRAPSTGGESMAKLVWAWASGLVFIVTGIAMIANRNARLLLLAVGSFILVWALFRHIPVVASNFRWGSEITTFGKALTLWGGAWAMAGTFPKLSETRFSAFVNQTHGFIYLGRFCLGTFMIIGGIEHFIFIDFVKTLVPAWIPGNVFWSYFAGVALIAGGLGLWIPRTCTLAAMLSGVMIFIWFVILHIPRALAGWNDTNEWISVVESLAVSGIAFILIKRTDSAFQEIVKAAPSRM